MAKTFCIFELAVTEEQQGSVYLDTAKDKQTMVRSPCTGCGKNKTRYILKRSPEYLILLANKIPAVSHAGQHSAAWQLEGGRGRGGIAAQPNCQLKGSSSTASLPIRGKSPSDNAESSRKFFRKVYGAQKSSHG